MARPRQFVALALVAVVAAGAGFAIHRHYLGETSTAALSAAAREAVFQTTLKDLAGNPQRLDQWRGKILILNFWATWCEPCRKEIPEFIRIQQQYRDQGLQFVGIAIDQPEKVASFAGEIQFNYPLLIGNLDAIELSRKLGNTIGALPFSVIIDRSGNLVRAELGVLDAGKLTSLLGPLLKPPNGG
jgi:thiol-disulfide isomerase/thioredoxin